MNPLMVKPMRVSSRPSSPVLGSARRGRNSAAETSAHGLQLHWRVSKPSPEMALGFERTGFAFPSRHQFLQGGAHVDGPTEPPEIVPQPAVIEERNRLAREIHDTLVQEFAGILLHLEAARTPDGAAHHQFSECLARARELARCGLEDARRMLLGLRPKSLEGAHLIDALRQLAESFSRDCGITCSFSTNGRGRELPENTQDELYRVAQEALCNVRKHSRANSVSIFLSYSSDGVLLTIRDNGQGFSPAKPKAGARGFGLATMGDRARLLGGNIDIKSEPATGTEVNISVPVAGERTMR